MNKTSTARGRRVFTLLSGGVVALLGLTVLTMGVVVASAAVDGGAYTNLGESAEFRSDGYAVASEPWDSAYALPGVESIRITVSPLDTGTAQTAGGGLFAGFAPAAKAADYLSGVAHTELRAGYTERHDQDGSAPSVSPADTDIWTTHAEGAGTQTIRLDSDDLAQNKKLTPIVLNADGSESVNAHWEIAYRIPQLGGIAAGLVISGAVLTAGGVLLFVRPIQHARRGALLP